MGGNKFGLVLYQFFMYLYTPLFSIDGFTFSYIDVIFAGVILSLIGIVIGKIFLFVRNDR